jgi:hypothetical protein
VAALAGRAKVGRGRGVKGGGVMAKAPGWSGEVMAGDGEKRQQGDAVGAAEAVKKVGDGDVELMFGVCRRHDGVLERSELWQGRCGRSACTKM